MASYHPNRDYIETDPEPVWQFVRRWGGHPLNDLRDAIATCLLEHLLEHHFEMYFPQVEQAALANPLFGDTFQRCWQIGQAQEAGNTERFVLLAQRVQTQAFTASQGGCSDDPLDHR